MKYRDWKWAQEVFYDGDLEGLTLKQVEGVFKQNQHLVKLLLKQIQPTCNKCEVNQARYTSGRCALCDMKLPEARRGERL